MRLAYKSGRNMKIPFLNLKVNNKAERREILAAVNMVLRHGRIVLGPEVSCFENKIAELCGRKYAVSVNSGTDALFLALRALHIGSGDEVITTSLSWVATANAIALTGATPVFADIRNDLNIDPASVQNLVTSRTKAIMPVHYTGKICAMPELLSIAKRHKLLVIEDAAQAFGASLKGKVSGSFGDIACFSMNPMKIYAACGEAGVVMTDSKNVYDRLVMLRYNGTINREKCVEPSLNARMDTVQAAILLKRLKKVEGVIKRRRQIAERYSKKLSGVVNVPVERKGEKDVYYTYTIRTARRDGLKKFLESKGIETRIQHPFLMPQQPAYRRNVKGCYANAKRIVKQVLCIPAHEKMTNKDVDYVAEYIRRFCDDIG